MDDICDMYMQQKTSTKNGQWKRNLRQPGKPQRCTWAVSPSGRGEPASKSSQEFSRTSRQRNTAWCCAPFPFSRRAAGDLALLISIGRNVAQPSLLMPCSKCRLYLERSVCRSWLWTIKKVGSRILGDGQECSEQFQWPRSESAQTPLYKQPVWGTTSQWTWILCTAQGILGPNF